METKKEINEKKLKDMMRKIKNLYAKAESLKREGSEDAILEAENFASQANKLLLEYNLSMDDVKASDLEDHMADHHVNSKILNPSTEGKWVSVLYNIVSSFNFCFVYVIDHGKSGMKVIGEKNNVEITLYICEQLIPRIRRAARDGWKMYSKLQLGTEKEGTFLRGFLMGAVMGINAKLKEEKDAQMAKHPQMAGLIIVHDTAIKKYIEGTGTTLKDGRKSVGPKSNDGAGMGFETGKSMQINKGLGTTNKENVLMLGAAELTEAEKQEVLEHFNRITGVDPHELFFEKQPKENECMSVEDYLDEHLPKKFNKDLVRNYFKEWCEVNILK